MKTSNIKSIIVAVALAASISSPAPEGKQIEEMFE